MSDESSGGRPVWRGRSWLRLVWAVVAVVAFYYPAGMVWVHRIDDDPDFAVSQDSVPPAASRAVAIAAALIAREVDVNRWTANDPFFLPAAALDNMPNFQQGIIAALSRFAIELTDQIGRTRGSSEVDPDLEKAAGLLKYSGTVWIFDLSTSWAPTAPSEQQYRAARRALTRYNERLAAGEAVFERRTDNLLATLDRFAADIGSSSAALDRHLRENAGWTIDTRADDLFYGVKGRLYAYYLLLRELAVDFRNVLDDRDLGPAWEQMLASFRAAATLDPWVVVNGAPDGLFLPSHLATQGFYLLRARTQLREITNILLK
ncbi:MAG: DUF2333 family protein [Alphaproteobacteria bacterium]